MLFLDYLKQAPTKKLGRNYPGELLFEIKHTLMNHE